MPNLIFTSYFYNSANVVRTYVRKWSTAIIYVFYRVSGLRIELKNGHKTKYLKWPSMGINCDDILLLN